MTTFIYHLESDGKPFYVGVSDSPYSRFKLHQSAFKNKENGKYPKMYFKFPNKFELFIVDEVKVSDFDFWERHYLSLYKSWNFNLLNTHVGGQSIGVNNRTPEYYL
ncbi:MAG: GIY-YIG nuclease family protein [Bacteroidota bacterium]